MNDPPPIGLSAEDQGKEARGIRVLAVASKPPSTKHVRGIWTEDADVEVVEAEGAHGISVGIAVLVPLQRSLPAEPHGTTRRKAQVRGVPIALHEACEIPVIPCADLRIQHGPDVCLRSSYIHCVWAQRRTRYRTEKQQTAQEKIPHWVLGSHCLYVENKSVTMG